MIRTIRELLVKGLYEDVGVLAVDTDNPHKKPEYPYCSFKVTSVLQNSIELGNIRHYFAESEDKNFKYDYVEELSYQPKIMMSFNAYSNDILECQEVALNAWEWFKHKSKNLFSDNNILVVSVGNVQDRTVFEGVNYEYRNGFDIEFRVVRSIESRSETIEEYKVEGEII